MATLEGGVNGDDGADVRTTFPRKVTEVIVEEFKPYTCTPGQWL